MPHRSIVYSCFAIAVALAGSIVTAEQTTGKTPDETVAGMQLREGFVASLVAGEPEVHQPIGFTIDERGRIWVAENYSYPAWKPTGNDRIVVLEDTDGDGYHEKRTVFYDKLNFVSGIEVGFGGVFVGAPPNLSFIPDRDGDLKPDGPPEVLLDGWGHRDTHETLNAFTWGPDGWLYGCHGVFTKSAVGKPGINDRQRERLNAGVWRYHPVSKKFEVFAHGTSNPWGVTFDENGECFITACVIPHAYHIVPGGRYERQAGEHFNRFTYREIKTIADHRHYAGGRWEDSRGGKGPHDAAGGGHAHAGALVYLGDQFPRQYRGKLLMNNIHGNRMNMDVLRPKGATFTASHGPDFMRAGDKWYRGLHIRLGPDGSIYFSDWYDPRACHQQRPNDRSNGRIYRISHGKPETIATDLSKLTNADLVELVEHSNEWQVATARRLLQERCAAEADAAVTAALAKRLDSDSVRVRLRALWALHAVGGLNDALLTKMLGDRAATGRMWAVRLIAESGDTGVHDLAALVSSESSAIVRREIASAMQRVKPEQRWEIAAAFLTRPGDSQDPTLGPLVWYGVESLVGHDAERALGLIDNSGVRRVNDDLIRRASSDHYSIVAVVKRLGATDDPDKIRTILRPMRAALRTYAPPKTPREWAAVYDKLTDMDDSAIRNDAHFIAVRFGDPTVLGQMRDIAANGGADITERASAIDVLVAGRDAGAGDVFRDALTEPRLRLQALRGLALTDDPKTPAAIVAIYEKMTAQEKRTALATLAGRKSYAPHLLQAIGEGRIARDDLSLATVRQMLGFKDERIAGLIEKHWGTVRSVARDKAEQMKKWKTLLNDKYMKTADVRNGRAVYNRVCAACHAMHGEGGKIGPELTGSNRTNLDYVLENVLDPNAVIGADYQLTVFNLKDGRVVSGMVRTENNTAVTVATAEQTTTIEKSRVKTRQALPVSMMPEGLFSTIQDSEVRDLIAYLRSARQVPPPSDRALHPPQ